MKTVKDIYKKLVLVVVSVLLTGSGLYAQEKASPKLRLNYVKHMDGSYEIKAHAFVKKGKDIDHCTAHPGCKFY